MPTLNMFMTDENRVEDHTAERPAEKLVEAGEPQIETEEANDVSIATPPMRGSSRKYVAYTVKLPAEQLAALQSIWLELKRLYGAHSPDKSGMIQQAIDDWLKKWEGPEHQRLLRDILEIREDTRRRQYRKTL